MHLTLVYEIFHTWKAVIALLGERKEGVIACLDELLTELGAVILIIMMFAIILDFIYYAEWYII